MAHSFLKSKTDGKEKTWNEKMLEPDRRDPTNVASVNLVMGYSVFFY